MQHLLRDYRRTLPTDRRQPARAVPTRRPGAQGRRASAASGTRAWIVLLLGRDDDDPLFLQVKEAAAVGAGGLRRQRASTRNAGERVVAGQRLMQAVERHLPRLARTSRRLDGGERDFYVRQLRDWKGSVEVEVMVPRGMAVYGQMCGWTLARAHARSGDAVAIAAYLGKTDAFDRAIAAFAGAYADQNERDYEALKAAVDSGASRRRPGSEARTSELDGLDRVRRTTGTIPADRTAVAGLSRRRRRWARALAPSPSLVAGAPCLRGNHVGTTSGRRG